MSFLRSGISTKSSAYPMPRSSEDIGEPSLDRDLSFPSLKLKYKTIYKELQNLVISQVLLKDSNKLYKINPGYGDKLIDYGLEIKGLKKPPNRVLFLNNFIEIKEKINQMEEYLIGKE